ncbi:MAG: flavodoxin domain-containing protein [Clostridia bacterium]|jgi:flavodoxin|nr:flavodoxin domain-containing protein [Clostridia bacterium]
MNIGIIVMSKTGHTLSVAQRLKDALTEKGHTVNLERVTAMNDTNKPSGKQLKDAPNTEPYDVLIFGSPVWASSLPSVMKAYMSQLPSLQGKKVGCFVTQSFPYAWMGGNRTVSQMKKICSIKGTTVFAEGVINWSNKKRENQIIKLIEKMSI